MATSHVGGSNVMARGLRHGPQLWRSKSTPAGCVPVLNHPCFWHPQQPTWNTTLCANDPLPDAMATSTWDSARPSGGTAILVDRNRPAG